MSPSLNRSASDHNLYLMLTCCVSLRRIDRSHPKHGGARFNYLHGQRRPDKAT